MTKKKKKKKAEEETEELHEYSVSGYLTISVVKTIMARDEDDAREKAEALTAPGLCHQCASAGGSDEDEWELNGFDDPPDDVVQNIEKVSEDDVDG